MEREVFGCPVSTIVENLELPVEGCEWGLLRILALVKEELHCSDTWLTPQDGAWCVSEAGCVDGVTPDFLKRAIACDCARVYLGRLFTTSREHFHDQVSIISGLFWGHADGAECALLTDRSFATSQAVVDALGGPEGFLPISAPVEGVRPVYFNSQYMGSADYCYVCWLDVMGTHNQMLRSLQTSANFVYKLHCAVLHALDETLSGDRIGLYPVMDGVYITADRRANLENVLKPALRRLAESFLQAKRPQYRFLVRGAIAYGPTYHGRDVQPEASKGLLDRHEQQRDSILMGLPMAQAYQAERVAPPYGIAIDDSARAFGPWDDPPYPFIWWDWFHTSDPPLDNRQMLDALEDYFGWLTEHTNMTGYNPDRKSHHLGLARELFGR